MAKKQRMQLKDDYTGDRISMLPDDILVLILSSLSLKDSIKTSILSSRWRNLWILTPKLDLDLDSTAILHKWRNYNITKIRCEFVRWVDHLFTILPKPPPILSGSEWCSIYLHSSVDGSTIVRWVDHPLI
ncbi:putative F-box/FBD/LRR-repeat protein [Salvia divinorum]|uniref:F-box/FBD/LRR-repeat protein n=1 Tax=Salvia divinorum TaxID=28513 RepID=A0ABD1FPZ8_SALDI